MDTEEVSTTVDPGIKVIVPFAESCGKQFVPSVVIVKVYETEEVNGSGRPVPSGVPAIVK